MIRLFALPAILLTVFFSALLSLIPSFAPETAVLSYFVSTPDHELAIHLLDVRSSLSYFTGFVTPHGKNLRWSPDGQQIATISRNRFPNSIAIYDLDAQDEQLFNLKSTWFNNYDFDWTTHPTKIAYAYGSTNEALPIYDRESREETVLMWDIEVQELRWLPDSDLLYASVIRAEDGEIALYEFDTVTNEHTLLRRNISDTHFELIDDPPQVIYSDSNQLLAFTPETFYETRLVARMDSEIRGFHALTHDPNRLDVRTEDGQIWLMDVNGDQQELILKDAPAIVRWSPNGEVVAMVVESPNTLSTIRLISNNEAVNDITIAERVEQLIWSPDSRYVLATAPSDYFYSTIYMIDTTNGHIAFMENIYEDLLWQPQPE